jgi:hypothetical protein
MALMSKGQILVKFDQSQHFKFQILKISAKYGIWGFAHSELIGRALEVKLSP